MPEGKQNISWLSKYFRKHDSDNNADKQQQQKIIWILNENTILL